YFRVQESQTVRGTEETIRKVSTGLDRHWTAVLDQAAQDARERKIPPAVVDLADGDLDRARSLWTYMRLMNEFPSNFDEARANIAVSGSTGLVSRATFLDT